MNIPVYIHPIVPLCRKLPDGTYEKVLFWRFENRILVHPDRWEEFCLTYGRGDDGKDL